MRKIHLLALLLPLSVGLGMAAMDLSKVFAADNTAITAGSGTAIATDDVAGIHYQKFKLVDGTNDAATPAIVTGAGALKVDGSAVTQPVSGTIGITGAIPAGTNNIGDVDVLTLPTLPAGNNNIGDVDVLSLPNLPAGNNNIGDVDVATLPALPAGNNNVGDVDVASFAAGAITEVQGDVAHDAAAAGNPVLNGAIAETPEDAAVANQVSADADAVRVLADREGVVYVHPHSPRIWHAAAEYTAAETDTSVKAAPGAGLSLYITDIYFAANGAVTITLEEGTSTLKFRYYAAAAGDGVSKAFQVPIKLTANTALTVTTSAAVTATVVVNGYTAP